VSVRSCSKDDTGVVWETEAIYIADDKGVVDLEKQAPVSGGYEGVDHLGLF
jgi:hypothetical protein